MDALELARWQFGVTTVYHFLFVPVSIGLATFVAILQTLSHRTGHPVYARMTKFWGKLLLISFALGVVTGIVQEFQFGMNWSGYSRYVGDIFGAPLAVEGLAAFFLESTFLGLWIFGAGRLSPRLHLASIWLVAFGTMLSAYFILAANSWMQHPVGYEINEVSGRAEMTDVFAVLGNSTALYAFAHTILAALTTVGMIVVGISAYQLLRRRETDLFLRSARIALPLALAAAVGVAVVGHFQAQLMTDQQPMKMAAAEALYETESSVGFSLFAVADFEKNPGKNNVNVTIPGALSFLATNSFDGEVEGINDIQREYEQRYGPGDYVPIVGVQYWTFRLMVGAGVLMIALSFLGLWLVRSGRLEHARWFQRLALAGIALPFLANATGWVFTEMGRQPWIVQGLLRTEDAVSPAVSTASVALTLAVFTALYGALAGVAGWLIVRTVKAGPKPAEELAGEAEPSDLTFAY